MMNTLMKSLLILLAIVVSVFAQTTGPEMKPPGGPGPVAPPGTTNGPQPPGSQPMAPSYYMAPAPAYDAKSIAPAPALAAPPSAKALERARRAEAKRQKSEETFRFIKVALDRTTEIKRAKNGDYSGKALFSVDGHNVVITCTSTVRGATAAFLESIKRIFANDKSADLSLEKIIERARQDLRDQPGLSGAEIKVQYIDQFGETHEV